MLSAQDIRDVGFNKAKKGYDSAEVDEFLDRCMEAVETLQKEKEELNQKLQVLADKLVEYRNDEDSVRTALLSAQRLGDTVVREANHKATLILEDAQIKANKLLKTAKKDLQNEEKGYQKLQKEISVFKTRLISLYNEHLKLIEILPEPEEVPAASESAVEQEVQAAKIVPEPVIESVRDSKPKTEPEPVVEAAPAVQAVEPQIDIVQPEPELETESQPEPEITQQVPLHAATEPAAPMEQMPPTIDDLMAPVTEQQKAIPIAEAEPEEELLEEEAVVKKSRFSDLKFGETYDLSQDEEESASEEDEQWGFFRRRNKD